MNINLSSHFLQLFISLTLLIGLVKPDPEPLQDYCVADTKSPLFINGAPCLKPSLAIPSHFTTSALAKPGNTKANQFGFAVTLTTLANLPGMNTMGLTMARVDIAPNGLVPPHSHPRASEVTICLQGVLLVGFVDTSNRQFTQQLKPGDSFVFPKGLIHYLYNLDSRKPALAISGLSSQNPGAQIASRAAFVSDPFIPDVVLEKAFQISTKDIEKIRRNLGG
ncbi:Germin [Corchorus olitorius]|uniref:Germin-like protein n=1 Tax=Corchorus olitorius TaxID=93759 RepID=A0A1R3GA96_9ROSI|nr:Germin [Corchorus olitorius]